MKKSIKLLSLFVFLFLLIPFTKVSAYTYRSVGIRFQDMINNGWISTWPQNDDYYVNTNAKHGPNTAFWFHGVEDGANIYVSICAGIGKSTYDDATVSINNGLDGINNVSGTMTDAQRELLKDLIVNGYQYTGKFNALVTSKESTLKMIAMQILAWEVIEGGRTNFSSVVPSYDNGNSAYRKLIYPNGLSLTHQGPSVEPGSLYYYYQQIVEQVNSALHPTDASAFDTDTYKLQWDAVNKKYTVTVSGLGKYLNCKSSDANNFSVSVNRTSLKATVTAPSTISDTSTATITCSYQVGNGTTSQADKFYYYSFPSSISRCANDGCQKIVYGTATRVYKKSFKVAIEKTSAKLIKKDLDGNELSGAVFILQNLQTPSYTLSFNNKNTVDISKSGEYKLKEVLAPKGFEKIGDTNITIDVSTGKVTDCANKGTDSRGNMTCKNGRIVITYDNGVIVFTVADVSKNIKIQKIDENSKPIVGAGFKVYDKDNNLIKFSLKSGNIYGYDPNGTVTELKAATLSSYAISSLPAGDYSIVETSVPYPYILPTKKANRTTKIKYENYNLSVYNPSTKQYEPSDDGTVKVTNFKIEVTIIKTGDDKLLEGVKFNLYKEDKTTGVKSDISNPGIYTYSETQSGDELTQYITNNKGEIVIKNLPSGVYYLHEIETVPPYQLPQGEEAYTKFEVDATPSGSTLNGSLKIHYFSISNTKNTFSFFKIDENGVYLKDGKFKIQKYDNTLDRYVDIKVKPKANDGTYNENSDVFEPAGDSDKDGVYTFKLKNGIATFTNMQSSTTYRIVEVEAPAGYIKVNTNDTATVTIDQYGNSAGLLSITNQKVSIKTGEAQAELIVNISTGVDRIKYVYIFGGLMVVIGGLFLAIKLLEKKDKK